MESFTASDLTHARRDVLRAARTREGAVVRDTDGTLLVFASFTNIEVVRRLAVLGRATAVLAASLDEEAVDPQRLHDLAFAALWPPSRRRQLVEDLIETMAIVESVGSIAPVEAVLEAHRPRLEPLGDRFDADKAWADLNSKDQRRIRSGKNVPKRQRLVEAP